MAGMHTPGPWEVSRDATPDYAPQFTIYSEDDGESVATAFRSEANARLIAAAPDLLEALRDVVRSIDGGMPEECATYSHRLRAAIEKATGVEVES